MASHFRSAERQGSEDESQSLSAVPEAYNPSLPWLAAATLTFMLLPQLSVQRFKAGKQDN